MVLSRAFASITLLVLLASASAATAQLAVDPDRFFGLEWAGGDRHGRPTVNGYIINNYRVRASNMRLLVESLDGGGKVTGSTSGVVADVPPGARVYFEVPVKQKAPRYRVTITAWEWREAGGQ